MPRLRKIARVASIVVVLFVVLVLLPLALVVSHDSPCTSAAAAAGGASAMKAITYRCYGGAEVLEFGPVAKPAPTDDEVLVKVHAASANPLDWHYLHGMPYLMRLDAGIGAPKNSRLGVDFAGTVEAVGRNVTRFKPGDAVFGGRTGAFGEYVTVRADRAIAAKPDNVSFAQAAAVPIAGLTALQALRDQGHLQAGQKVLINGASGGVGTFAVQIAKALGAEVTGVCSTKNLDLVRRLGADHVIDYTREDFTQGDKRYDLIVDLVGSHGLLEYRRVLNPHANFVIVGGAGRAEDGKWIGPMAAPIRALLLSPFVSQHFGMMLANLNPTDLALLAGMMAAGKVTPVIDHSYPLSEVADALRYLEKGHARGKVVIAVLADDAASANAAAATP